MADEGVFRLTGIDAGGRPSGGGEPAAGGPLAAAVLRDGRAGGITRLTLSGLPITEWQSVVGIRAAAVACRVARRHFSHWRLAVAAAGVAGRLHAHLLRR
ncbi:MAG TPA: hypothetical protein VND95_13370 [Stellaceae bacterium]|nr:hypothetical protein [Stellaceae bacterium]